MIIGADGANSRIAKEIDAGEYDYAIAFQERIRIPDDKMKYYENLAEMYVGDDVSPDFYGWVSGSLGFWLGRRGETRVDGDGDGDGGGRQGVMWWCSAVCWYGWGEWTAGMLAGRSPWVQGLGRASRAANGGTGSGNGSGSWASCRNGTYGTEMKPCIMRGKRCACSGARSRACIRRALLCRAPGTHPTLR